MMRSRTLFVIALAIALAWIALGVETFVFLGLADREKIGAQLQTMVEKEALYAEARAKGFSELDSSRVATGVRAELDTALWWNSAVIGLGIVTILAGLALPRHRNVAVLISSVVYWVLWYRYGFPTEVSFVDAYRLKWLAASTLNMRGTFFFKDVVLPLTFGASAIAGAITLVGSYRKPAR